MKKLIWLAILLPISVFAQELEPRVNANENSVQALSVRVDQNTADIVDLNAEQNFQNDRLDNLELDTGGGVKSRIVVDDVTDEQIGVAQGSAVFWLQFIDTVTGANNFVRKFGSSYAQFPSLQNDVQTTDVFMTSADMYFDCNTFGMLGWRPQYHDINNNQVVSQVPPEGSSQSVSFRTGAQVTGDVVGELVTTATVSSRSGDFTNIDSLDPNTINDGNPGGFPLVSRDCVVNYVLGNAIVVPSDVGALHTFLFPATETMATVATAPSAVIAGGEEFRIIHSPAALVQAQAAKVACETVQTIAVCKLVPFATPVFSAQQTPASFLPPTASFTTSVIATAQVQSALVGNRGAPRTFSEDYR